MSNLKFIVERKIIEKIHIQIFLKWSSTTVRKDSERIMSVVNFLKSSSIQSKANLSVFREVHAHVDEEAVGNLPNYHIIRSICLTRNLF